MVRRSVARVLRQQASCALWPGFEHLTLAERSVLAGELRIIADLIDVEP